MLVLAMIVEHGFWIPLFEFLYMLPSSSVSTIRCFSLVQIVCLASFFTWDLVGDVTFVAILFSFAIWLANEAIFSLALTFLEWIFLVEDIFYFCSRRLYNFYSKATFLNFFFVFLLQFFIWCTRYKEYTFCTSCFEPRSSFIRTRSRVLNNPAPSVCQSVRQSVCQWQKFSYFQPLVFSDFLHQVSLK